MFWRNRPGHKRRKQLEKQEHEHRGAMPVSVHLAIINDNVLTGIGLQHLLEDMLPAADITVYNEFSDVADTTFDNFAHYFVASRLYFEHAQFFHKSPKKTIVLVGGDISIPGVRTLNICQGEKSLTRDILALYNAGHGKKCGKTTEDSLLSTRETEVAVLLCKGYRNKEVAEILNISVTTVISHRKNIILKLHARSLADIIIYAVMNGLVDIGEL